MAEDYGEEGKSVIVFQLKQKRKEKENVDVCTCFRTREYICGTRTYPSHYVITLNIFQG